MALSKKISLALIVPAIICHYINLRVSICRNNPWWSESTRRINRANNEEQDDYSFCIECHRPSKVEAASVCFFSLYLCMLYYVERQIGSSFLS